MNIKKLLYQIKRLIKKLTNAISWEIDSLLYLEYEDSELDFLLKRKKRFNLKKILRRIKLYFLYTLYFPLKTLKKLYTSRS